MLGLAAVPVTGQSIGSIEVGDYVWCAVAALLVA